MKALLVRSKLIDSFLGGVAQSLVKYANVIESYLPRDDKFEEESADENSIQTPPLHWLEKVRLGAPHLLEQNTYANEPDFSTQTDEDAVANTTRAIPPLHWLEKVKQGAPHLLVQDSYTNVPDDHSAGRVETEIQPTSNTSYRQKNILKQKPVQPFVYKKSDKVFASINKLFRQSKNSVSLPSAFLKRNTPISVLKLNKKTVTKNSTTINKTKDATLADKSSNIDAATVGGLAINKKFKDQIINKKPSSQKTASESLPIIDKAREQTSSIQKQTAGLTEYALLNSKNKIHLYPRSSFKTNTKQINQGNEIEKARFEGYKQAFSANEEDKNFKVSETQQQNLFSSKKDKVLSNTLKNKQSKDKPLETEGIQPATLNKAVDKLISFENHQQRIKTKSAQSSSIKWSSAKREKKEEITDDRWPQLPKQQWQQSKDTQPHSIDFWRAQNQVESKLLSDLEQRGKLWNA